MKYFVSVITLIFTIAFAGELSQPLCQSSDKQAETQSLPDGLASFFQPPAEFAGDFGDYRSPLKFYDGRPVETVADWQQRRQEILRTWHGIMGEWLPLLDKPAIEYLEKEQVENFTRQKVKVEIAPDHRTIDGYLMIPLEGDEPFPAVIVVYYDPETGAGLGKELRDFGYQLAKRGFITLSVGMQASLYYPDESNAILQPLSALAYAAANCYNALAALPQVDRSGLESRGIPMAESGLCSLPVSMINSPAPPGQMAESSLMKADQCQLLGTPVRAMTGM